MELARSTLCDWVGEVAATVVPVVDHLKQDLLASDLIATDDTTVPVLVPGQKVTAKGRLWVYVGDEEYPAVVFYTPTYERAGLRRFSTASPATCRRTPTTATTASTPAAGCWRSAAGCTRGAISSKPRRPTRTGRVGPWR